MKGGLPILSINTDNWRFRHACLPFWNGLTIGGAGSDIRVPGCSDGVCVILQMDRTGYALAAVKGFSAAEKEGGRPDDRYYDVFRGENRFFQVHIRAVQRTDIPRFDRTVALQAGTWVKAGNGQDNTLVYPMDGGPGRWLTLIVEGDSVEADPGEPVQGGLWLNNRRLTAKEKLHEGDFITCCGMHLQYAKKSLLACSDEMVTCRAQYVDEKEQKSHLSYPMITRTSREIPFLNTEEIKVLDPPAPIEPQKNRLLLSLLPSVSMVVLTLTLRASFTSNTGMIMFSALSMGIGGVTAAINNITTRRDNKEKSRKRESGYRQYIEECDHRIEGERIKEEEALRAIYVTPAEELRRVRDFSAELFDRRVTDADFLDLYLGTGTVDSRRKVTCASHEKYEAVDELFQLPPQMAEKYRKVRNVPVTLKTGGVNAVGFVGNIQRSRDFLRNLVLDLAVRHFFGDIRLFAFFDDLFSQETAAFHMLPHFYDADSDRRFVSHDTESKADLTEILYRILSGRDQNDKKGESAPWIVVLAESRSVLEHPLMQFVPRANELHCLFLFFVRHTEFLPQGCSDKVLLFNNRAAGAVIALDHHSPDLLFDYRPISVGKLQAAAERLAPVYAGALDLASELPSDVSLMQLLGASAFQSEEILLNWAAANTVRSLAAPLGKMENGKVLSLDLHEAAHGPHGLVAGTTGSGKSQVLISYILSVASHYSPEDVNFAVIDFKGGDIVHHLEGLPHIIGSITNLDDREIDRSLRFINAEKTRRMQLFSDGRVKAANISEYITAYRKGLTDVPLPHLVIIVDEFAELKQQRPDFMADLISLSRVGRSLGIHLVLCTQKPSGVVDGQIWGNTDFHLSLRVQNKEDSNEVIKSPMAAEIRVPGRGYLQVSRTETFALFQSGYSGGAFSDIGGSIPAYSISERSISGRRKVLYSHRAQATEHRIQAQVMLEGIIAAFRKSGMAVPRQLTVPQIPTAVPFKLRDTGKKYSVCVGLYDDPDHQAVEPLVLDLPGTNILVVGGPQMGKTNLLQTVIRALTETCPGEARVYAMDFNANALKNMEDMDLISGTVMADQEEKLKSFLRLLKAETERRKNRLMEARVTGFEAYAEQYGDMPLIVVMLDNAAVFKEMYSEKYSDLLIYLMREGPSLGISFLVTATHLSDLHFRMAHCFGERIVMPMSEKSEIMSVLEGCRQEPLAAPGRVLIKRDKVFFEGQVFLAFEGDNDSERSVAMRDYILAHSTGKKAGRIPEIPKVLSWSYIRGMEENPVSVHYPFGLSFRTVQPVFARLEKDFCMAVSGKDEKILQRFVSFFTAYSAALAREKQAQLIILDDFSRTLSSLAGDVSYTTDPEAAENYITQATQVLEERRKKRQGGDQSAFAPIIFIVNGADMLMSLKSSAVTGIRTMADKYRREGVFFLFGGVPNKPVSFSSPDILKLIRDEKHLLVFDEIGSVKITDVSVVTARENNRPLEAGEAFLFWGDELERIRVPDINDMDRKEA